MKKKQQQAYLDNEWDEMDSRLTAFFKTSDQEQLHKFRVQIKKIKAMLNLFERTSRQHGLLKQLKPVKKMFRHAGVIRDAFINIELFATYQLKNDVFELSQQTIIDDGIMLFKKNEKEYLKQLKQTRKLVFKHLTPIDKSAILDYYNEILEYIALNMKTLKFNEDIHTARKQIKILIYNYKIVKGYFEDHFGLNIKYLDDLQDAIGKWHDNQLAEQLFSMSQIDDKTIVVQIKKKNVAVKRRITVMAKNFLQKARIKELEKDKE